MLRISLILLIFSLNSFASIQFKNDKNEYLLVVNKEEYQSHLYLLNQTRMTKIRTFRNAFGKKLGDKKTNGDLKTPEGIYQTVKFLNKNLLKKYYPNYQKFGNGAFILNYPNDIDKIKNKDGFGIWLHGVDEPSRISKKNISQGCILFYNKDLNFLRSIIQNKNLKVIINQNISEIKTLPFVFDFKKISKIYSSDKYIEYWINDKKYYFQ